MCLPPLQPRRRATGELQPTAIAARVYDWNKIYQSSPILNHLTSLTSICIGQGVWEERWLVAPWRWQGSAWGSWPNFPCWASEEGGEQELYVMQPYHDSRLLSVEAWGATSTLRRLRRWSDFRCGLQSPCILVIKYSNKHDCSPSKKKKNVPRGWVIVKY